MTTELAEQKTYSTEQIALLKNTIAKDHSDDELKLFLAFCSSKRLDPFSREVYSIKRAGKLTFQMGIDGLRSKAEESGEYDGIESYWCDGGGEWKDIWLSDSPPIAAKVLVYRKNCQKPFIGIAKWAEYKPQDNDFMWRKMPSSQLAKCAEALALRKAFPNSLGGIYSVEEMQQANNGKPSIAMPKARESSPVIGVADTVKVIDTGFAEDRSEGISDGIPETIGSDSEIGFGEPPAEARKVEEKVEQAFGKEAKIITPKQRKLLWAKCKQANVPENLLRTYVKDHFNIEHTDQLTMMQLDELILWVDRYAKLNPA